MFVIDPRDKAPVYEQMSRQLRWQIAMGYLKPDEALPSVRQLSTELGINPNTIQKAYRQMETEGLIYSRPGKGSFVTPSVDEERKRQQDKQLQILHDEVAKAREMKISQEIVLSMISDIYGGMENVENGAS